MTTKKESAKTIRTQKIWKLKSKNSSSKTPFWPIKIETLKKILDYQMLSNKKYWMNWTNIADSLKKMIVRTRAWKKRCKIFFKKTNIWMMKSGVPNKTWDSLRTRFPNWIMKSMNTGIEWNQMYNNLKLTKGKFTI